ncbi:MAG: hypothetical protein ACKO5K_01395 [Armatimonadota bacterium]
MTPRGPRLSAEQLAALERLLQRHANGQASDDVLIEQLRTSGADLIYWARQGLRTSGLSGDAPSQWYKDL